MERIEPSNSVKMPAMNFGVYWITDPTECEAAVLSDLKAGWRGIISISETVSPARKAENLAASNVKLTPEDMAKIATLDTGTSRFFSHRDPKIVEWLCTRRLPSEP